MSDKNEGLGALKGLAKRWLKSQISFKGDPMQGAGNNQQAADAEYEAKRVIEEETQRAAVTALLPQSWKKKLGEMEEYKQQQQTAKEQRQRAELEARPRAQVELRLTGDVAGSFSGEIPVELTVPESTGEPLTIVLEPLAPFAIGSQTFDGFGTAIPSYAGPGRYDLVAIGDRDGSADWDYLWFYLWLDSVDEQFYWSPPAPASIEVSPDERTFTIDLEMEDAGSRRVRVHATVELQ